MGCQIGLGFARDALRYPTVLVVKHAPIGPLSDSTAMVTSKK